MAADRRRIRPSRLVLAVLLAALAVGVAASIVVEDRYSGPPPPVGPSQGILLPGWVVAAVVVGLFLLVIAPILIDQFVNGRRAIPGRYIVFVLTILLLMIAFVEVAHFLGFTSGGFQEQGMGHPAPSNSSGPPPNATGTNLTGNGSTLVAPKFHFPSWVPFLVVVGIAVSVAAVGAPRLFEYLEDRRAERWSKRATDEAARALHEALGRAGEELEGGRDPREVVLALYRELLIQIRPLVADVDHDTPEEIRALYLVRLGVRSPAADALTRVFEEARYSTHPIGAAEVERAAKAIGEAKDDLRRTIQSRAGHPS